jgi:gluconokinase
VNGLSQASRPHSGSRLVLALEASTTSAKALVVSSDGEILRQQIQPYPLDTSDGQTQDVGLILDLLMACGKQVAEGLPIEAIGLSGIWQSLLLTRDGVPQERATTWLDDRAAGLAWQIRQDETLASDLYTRTGCVPHPSYPLYRLIDRRGGIDGDNPLADGWTASQWPASISGRNPDLEIGAIGDWIFRQLTGIFATSGNLASGSGLYNLRARSWDSRALELAGLHPGQLPDIVPYNSRYALLPIAAARLGLPAGLPVSLPFADGCLNQLGVDALMPGEWTISVGTSAAIRAVVDRPPSFSIQQGLWCYQAFDQYMIGAATAGGTNLLDWFKVLFAPAKTLEELDRLAFVPDRAGCEAENTELHSPGRAPVFLPFVFGERAPGWNPHRHGGFFVDGRILDAQALEDPQLRQELTERFGLGVLYWSVLAGILFSLRQSYDQLARLFENHRLSLSGGILHSAGWQQLAADVFGRPMERPDNSQASAVGAARMAFLALDRRQFPLFRTNQLIDEGGESVPSVPPRPLVQPQSKEMALLDALYQAYLAAYVATQPE